MVEQYSSLLRAYLIRRLRQTDEADDYTQEIFSRFIRRFNQDPTTVRDPMSFMYGIALNVVREARYRSQHSRITFDSDLAEAADGPDPYGRAGRPISANTAEQFEMREDICYAISQLPSNQLSAWWLVDVEGMSYEEAARTSGFTRNTISVYASNARAALKRTLHAYL